MRLVSEQIALLQNAICAGKPRKRGEIGMY